MAAGCGLGRVRGDREVWMLFSRVVGRPERRKRKEGEAATLREEGEENESLFR
ncbi:hypothetical protein HAX54_000554, partial [Datura stramonium]|nr:hypothetical protein [Datura stramonium]